MERSHRINKTSKYLKQVKWIYLKFSICAPTSQAGKNECVTAAHEKNDGCNRPINQHEIRGCIRCNPDKAYI